MAPRHWGGSLNFLVGLIPGGGELNDLAGIGGTSLGDLVTNAPDDGAAEAAARAYLDELDRVGAVTMTTHHYNQGLLDPHDALESMRQYLSGPHEDPVQLTDADVEHIFFDWDGTPRERLHLAGMNDDQRTAFGRWATSPGVTRSLGTAAETPLQLDVVHLRSGLLDAAPLTNQHGR